MRKAALAKGIRDRELLAYTDRCRALDFLMARESASALGLRIVIHAVSGALSKKQASVLFKVADQIYAFHGSGDGDSDFLAHDFRPGPGLAGQFAIGF